MSKRKNYLCGLNGKPLYRNDILKALGFEYLPDQDYVYVIDEEDGRITWEPAVNYNALEESGVEFDYIPEDDEQYIYAEPGTHETEISDVKDIHSIYNDSCGWYGNRNNILSGVCDKFAEIINSRMNNKEDK